MVTSAPGRTVWLWGCERIAGEFSELENWNVPFVPVLSLAVMAIVVNPGEKTRNRSAPPLTPSTLSAASNHRAPRWSGGPGENCLLEPTRRRKHRQARPRRPEYPRTDPRRRFGLYH